MKRTSLIFFCLIASILSSAQSGLQWAKVFNGIGSKTSNAIVADASGNVYTTGYFEGSVDFDPGSGTYTIASSSSRDIFISKLDPNGNFIWAKNIGWGEGKTICIGVSGNVLVAGHFGASTDFDPGPGTFTINTFGYDDVFVCNLSSSGSFIWAKAMGGNFYDGASSITTDVVGNIYLTGYFYTNADFDPGPGTFTLTGYQDIFVCKLDANGNFVWAKSMGGSGQEVSGTIALDASNNVYTTGSFESTADFDPGSGTFTLTPSGWNDAFISKLDVNGNFIWANKIGGSASTVHGNSVINDPTGNIYIMGDFNGTVDFDPGVGVYNLSTGSTFICKLSWAGTFILAKEISGVSMFSMTRDSEGNIYLTGNFLGTADFDPGVGTYNITATTFIDAFGLKLDANGGFVWARNIGGTDFAEGKSITIDAAGNVYITGDFRGTVDFDPGSNIYNLISTTNSNNNGDVFVTKWSNIVGIKENNNSNIFNIYLNPNNGLFSAQLNSNSQIIISNVLGQEILNENLPIGKHNLDIQNQANGLYFVKVIDENKNSETQKIIKQ